MNSINGAAKIGQSAKIQELTGGLTDVHTVADPTKVAPRSSTIEAGAKFVREFPGNSVTVIRLTTR